MSGQTALHIAMTKESTFDAARALIALVDRVDVNAQDIYGEQPQQVLFIELEIRIGNDHFSGRFDFKWSEQKEYLEAIYLLFVVLPILSS